MVKHNKDLDKLVDMKDDFISKALELRSIFGEIMYNLLIRIVGLGDYSKNDIVDILSQDVKIDNVQVKFKMVLISNNKEYLEYVDKTIEDDKVYNLFPNKFFRFYVDSYNDGIAKAYPELFKDIRQNTIGTGKDADVFCHSFTFQTSEACSLSCTYCMPAGTKILMANFKEKNIEDIVVGDIVLGFDEFSASKERINLYPTTVTELFKRESKDYYRISHPMLSDELRLTGEHPILTVTDKWVKAKDLSPFDGIVMVSNVSGTLIELFNYRINHITHPGIVYNFSTSENTYIANRILVHNCYQFNKSPMRMSFDTAKKFIDELLADNYGYINRYNSPAIILEFIGGEPLLEINLTRKIYEYFLDQTYDMNHPWFKLHRLSICSNGMQYFNEEVQDFFKEYSGNISFNISIDGNRELHDSCRKQPNGEGSYDIDMVALNHFNKHYTPERNSKMTLAPSNMKYLFESVKNFIENDMKCINLNCVFEEGWNQETALLEYNELKKLADYILENDLENIFISIFNERQEDIALKSNDGNFCGGASAMLALRPTGQFYTCIRYMPTSVGSNVKDLCIGTVQDGMLGREQGSDILKIMDGITRRSQSNDICYNCPIGNDCAWCSGLSHTTYGTPNKRPTFICIQMIAEALANGYFFNLLNIKNPHYKLPVRKNNIPDSWSLLVIDQDELDYLKKIEAYSMIITIEEP